MTISLARSGVRRVRNPAVLLLLLLAAVLPPSGRVHAHAALVGSEPADGAVLAAPPVDLVLRFSEAVTPLVLKLIGPDGAVSVLDGPTGAAAVLRIPPPPSLGRGTHVLSWRVVSADGHPVGGAVVFAIGEPSALPTDASQAADRSVQIAIWLTRLALYAGLFGGVGGAFFMAWTSGEPRQGRWIAISMLAAGLVAAPLGLALQGADAVGLPLRALADPAVWRAGAGTSVGPAVLIAVLALILGLGSLFARRRGAGRLLAFAALLATGAVLAATGHAANAPPQWLARPAVFVHGVAVAWWLGALLPLALLLRAEAPEAGRALRRFSRAAPWAIAVLAVAGLVLAVLQVPDPDRLFDTGYGRVLVAKLVLVAVTLGIAAMNRWRLTGRAMVGEGAATRRLARLILLETVIAAAVLGCVALWRFTPPPRTLAVPMPVAAAHVHDARAMADLTLIRERGGLMSAEIAVMTGDFRPLEPKEVTLVLANPGAGVEAIRRSAERSGDGGWRVEGLPVASPGRWQARIDILVSDFELVTLEAELEVRR